MGRHVPRGERLPLAGVTGLYVALFPERVKFGKAGHLRKRLREHARVGMTDVRVWRVPLFFPSRDVERTAGRFAWSVADRIAYSESFVNLPFRYAVEVMTTSIRMHGCLALAEQVDMVTLTRTHTSTEVYRMFHPVGAT